MVIHSFGLGREFIVVESIESRKFLGTSIVSMRRDLLWGPL